MKLNLAVAIIAMAITIGIVLGVRIGGPHDLYEKDQPKTMAYTADIVLHGRFSLPRDVIYQPATKPPMYNWIDAAIVKLTGSWDEWALKFPSLLASLATAATVFVIAWRCGGIDDGNRETRLIVALLATAAWFTCGIDVRHGSVIRMTYLARPDMLMCAWITGAWLCAMIVLQRQSGTRTVFPALGFWLCVTAAALTKGPAAVMPIVFAGVMIFILPKKNRRRSALNFYPQIGVPILILGVGAWITCAYCQDPDHVKRVLIGAELAGRLTQTPEGFAKARYSSAMWFLSKTGPWGILAVIGTIVWLIALRFRLRYTFVGVWLIIVLICLSIPAAQRMDYVLPAYPPAVIFGAMLLVWACGRAGVPTSTAMIVPLLVAIMLARGYATKFHRFDDSYSDNAVAFAQAVHNKIDPDNDGQRVFVLVRGKNPLSTLLGQHPGSYLTRDDLVHAEYVIMPLQPDLPAVLTSAPLPLGFETVETRATAPLGLYHFAPGTAPVERLIDLQKQVGTWTPTENPYHAPNTVYRDSGG